MKKITAGYLFLFFVLVFIFAGEKVARAEKMPVYSDKQNSFQIEYPKGWIKKINSLKYNVLFQNKENNVVYGILIKKSSAKASAKEYLDSTEKKMKMVNIAEVHSLPKEELKKIGADDSRVGVYQDKSYVIKYTVFTRKNIVYALIQTIRSGPPFEKYGEILDQMTASFKIK
jgi:hypothetical protein